MEELKELKLAEAVKRELQGNVTGMAGHGTVEEPRAPGSSKQAQSEETQVLVVRELPREQVAGAAGELVSSQVAVITREQVTNVVAEVSREQSRAEPVSQVGNQPVREEIKTAEPAREETKSAEPAREVTQTAEPAREDSKTAEPASIEVLDNPECLRCRFGCVLEEDLDNHMEREHQVPQPMKMAVHPNGMPCQDCLTKEALLMTHTSKIERLELQLTDIETDMKAVTADRNKLSEEKTKTENEYGDASRAIADLQRKLTESMEHIKTLNNLAEIGEQESNPDTEKNKPKEWEEVWEVNDDNSGNLVPQRRTEISKYQWQPELACKKCDKVLQSDQQFRQHIKEHKRLNEQIIKCHHCDFITNDEDAHINHMVDVHSTKHTCNSCEAVFPTKKDMIEHARTNHGFNYIKNGQKNAQNSIECHDCQGSFNNKFELMEHKKAQHYKKRLCSYYHGTGWGCRFLNRCNDIHGEDIVPQISGDNRSKIPCRHGDSCHYNKNNSCHYKHISHMPLPSAPPLELDDEDVQLLERVKCPQCSYETNSNIELGHHIESQHGARQKDYRGIVATKYPVGHPQWAINRNMNQDEHKCNECNSVFTIESMLHAHISYTHNINNKHICTKCSQVFNTNKDMNEHINQNHGGGFSIEAAMQQMSAQINNISLKVQSLEQSSLTNFPNLGPTLRKK